MVPADDKGSDQRLAREAERLFDMADELEALVGLLEAVKANVSQHTLHPKFRRNWDLREVISGVQNWWPKIPWLAARKRGGKFRNLE